ISAVSLGLRCVASGGRFWACASVATHSDVASNIITKASLGMCGVLDVGKGMGAALRYGLSTMDSRRQMAIAGPARKRLVSHDVLIRVDWRQLVNGEILDSEPDGSRSNGPAF